jgi:hypothetical protein
MELIKEPLDVDFYIDPRPMTKEDEKAISDYIKADKLKRSNEQRRSTKSLYAKSKVKLKNKV